MMRPTAFVIAAALTGATSGTAIAQTTPAYTVADETDNVSVLSGFVGSNFGTTNETLDLDGGASLAFGVQTAYLWRGIVGGEFIADFAPNLGDLLFANEPDVNSYMFNVIGAAPLGGANSFQPYVSGGVGAVQMRGDLFDVLGNPFRSNETRFGGNIGAGVMAFAEHVGIRADIRYYRTTSRDDSVDVVDDVADTLDLSGLSGLRFWRGNVGVAVRW
jgi:hypothetical protein